MDDEDARRAALLVELWSTAHQAERAVAQELAARDVDGEQLTLLLRLALAPSPVTPSSLARDLGVPFTTLRHALLRLLDRGDARRLPNPRDGRSFVVELTPAGRARAEAAAPALAAAAAAVAEQLAAGGEADATVALRALRGRLAEAAAAVDTTISL